MSCSIFFFFSRISQNHWTESCKRHVSVRGLKWRASRKKKLMRINRGRTMGIWTFGRFRFSWCGVSCFEHWHLLINIDCDLWAYFWCFQYIQHSTRFNLFRKKIIIKESKFFILEWTMTNKKIGIFFQQWTNTIHLISIFLFYLQESNGSITSSIKQLYTVCFFCYYYVLQFKTFYCYRRKVYTKYIEAELVRKRKLTQFTNGCYKFSFGNNIR